MASVAAISSSAFLQGQPTTRGGFKRNPNPHRCRKPRWVAVRAAKLPVGVEAPKAEPMLTEPLWGFTTTAEIWNSRACMLGILGTFILELILHKGILQMIGVDVGKGLDLPL